MTDKNTEKPASDVSEIENNQLANMEEPKKPETLNVELPIKIEPDTQKPESEAQPLVTEEQANKNDLEESNKTVTINKEGGEKSSIELYFSDNMPSQYPVTNVVYIKNLSRPLATGEFGKFLKFCAGGAVPQLLWFDSIKTHCFVKFEKLAAAQKVRETLNNTRFPAQELQRPLMATDYIPADKLDEWIKKEEEQGPRSLTRWVVEYKKDQDGNISAELVTEGANTIASRIDLNKTGDKRPREEHSDAEYEHVHSPSPSPRPDERRSHHPHGSASPRSPSRSRSGSFTPRSQSRSRSYSRDRMSQDEQRREDDDDDNVYYTKTLPEKAFREASPMTVRQQIRRLGVSEITDVEFKKNLNYSTHGCLVSGSNNSKRQQRQRSNRGNGDRPNKRRRRNKGGRRRNGNRNGGASNDDNSKAGDRSNRDSGNTTGSQFEGSNKDSKL